MLRNLIKEYLVSNASVDPALFDQPGLMISDLALDSLTLVEMLFEVEDRFGFQVSDPMRFRTMSFSEMVAAIEQEVRDHHNGELPDLAASQPAFNGK
ncbi:MAG: acyl carrier protein [Aquabacterium sp.]